MLTHFNVGSNVTQNIHPGTSRNQLATGTSYISNISSNSIVVEFNHPMLGMQISTKKRTFVYFLSFTLTASMAS